MLRHNKNTDFPLQSLIRYFACILILCISTDCTIIIVEDAKGMLNATQRNCTAHFAYILDFSHDLPK